MAWDIHDRDALESIECLLGTLVASLNNGIKVIVVEDKEGGETDDAE